MSVINYWCQRCLDYFSIMGSRLSLSFSPVASEKHSDVIEDRCPGTKDLVYLPVFRLIL